VTLIELLVVCAIVAILARIAVSSYSSQMLRTRRVDATAALLQVQVAQEKFFLQNRAYAADNAQLQAAPPAGLGLFAGAETPGGRFDLTLTAPTATTYTITAIAKGAQTNDTAACQTYTIDETGTRVAPVASSDCWH
jgi:type IV pilus assembly protein PilE